MKPLCTIFMIVFNGAEVEHTCVDAQMNRLDTEEGLQKVACDSSGVVNSQFLHCVVPERFQHGIVVSGSISFVPASDGEFSSFGILQISSIRRRQGWL